MIGLIDRTFFHKPQQPYWIGLLRIDGRVVKACAPLAHAPIGCSIRWKKDHFLAGDLNIEDAELVTDLATSKYQSVSRICVLVTGMRKVEGSPGFVLADGLFSGQKITVILGTSVELVTVDQYFVLTGRFTLSNKYGLQFRANEVLRVRDLIADLLVSGAVIGIGESSKVSVLETLGQLRDENVVVALQWLNDIKGVGKKRALAIRTALKKEMGYQEI